MNKFDNFKVILDKKFMPTELTYARYLGIAEQVFLAGLDNLENSYLALKSVSAVDVSDLQQRIEQHQNSVDTNRFNEMDALKKRLQIYHDQNDRVDFLIRQNEYALTELDNVTSKLANVQTQKGLADVDMDLAMDELSRIAQRAESYRYNSTSS